jgi:hypothetical protein
VGKRYRMDEGEIEVDSITPIGFSRYYAPSSRVNLDSWA